jgi:hypothetical protein
VKRIQVIALWSAIAVLGGCGQQSEETQPDSTVASAATASRTIVSRTSAPESVIVASNPLLDAYFGDLHVHTRNSVDAYNMGVKASPDDAYRYAQGETIQHPLGYAVRLRSGPLDFYAVTDHAEYLGVFSAIMDPKNPIASHPLAILLRSDDASEQQAAFLVLGDAMNAAKPVPGLDTGSVVRSTWQANIEAAERHNKPGEFTTFIAYEYSATPNQANLHRNVIFADTRVPESPFGAADSGNPEDLWAWLDLQRSRGMDSLAIPHNSNWSQGLMFQRNNWAGEPINTAYTDQRIRNEPLVEITQVKGTSETHQVLSPTDEWAAFEVWKNNKSVFNEDGTITSVEGETEGSYVRDALGIGLELEASNAGNPYKLGFIGASDGHDASSPIEEDQYFGKLGIQDGTAIDRGSVPRVKGDPPPPAYSIKTLEWGASGLTGVWAESNTRSSLFSALRRKEVFATSGPRIRVRFFAGYEYPDTMAESPNALELAYQNGVPMGGDLVQTDIVPRFFVWAARDPSEAWLQRAQIVKGWLADGESYEQVFDVACSDGAKPDATTHRCPDNGASVNLDDCSYSVGQGAGVLGTLWQDPAFDPDQRAFYYLRVLQNPTCRWSTWDAIRAGVAPSSEVPALIQERAWSSPIWYTPAT